MTRADFESHYRVLQDWLFEHGFDVVPAPGRPAHLPPVMVYAGETGKVFIYWYDRRGPGREPNPDGVYRLDVVVSPESLASSYYVPFEVAHQYDVPLGLPAFKAIGRALQALAQLDAHRILPQPGVPRGMERPDNLSSDGKKAWGLITDFLVGQGLTYVGGCRAFYEPKAWAETDHDGIPDDAVLVLVYDGGELHELLESPGYYELRDRLEYKLAREGFMLHSYSNVIGWISRDGSR